MLGLIGKKVEVKDSRNPSLIGIRGEIVDETKNMLIIRTRKGEVKVEKRICSFEVDGKLVEGKEIVGMPWERLKRRKKVRTRW
ncbi:ribonuclease P protein subunit [Nanoarchaeota archaeon]|nr:MAG: ribonuclease P protein subunit [Nanoarchaeota archaeon]